MCLFNKTSTQCLNQVQALFHTYKVSFYYSLFQQQYKNNYSVRQDEMEVVLTGQILHFINN